jgi:hypothetical protein
MEEKSLKTSAGKVLEAINIISNGGNPRIFNLLKTIIKRNKIITEHKPTDLLPVNKDIFDTRLKNKDLPKGSYLPNGERQFYV